MSSTAMGWECVGVYGIVLALAALLATGAVVQGQFIDGGEVSVTCTSCSCEGTSDAGSITVLDNPSTGNRMVSVDGEFSDIAETSCGASVFAVGSTIYELSGIDLISRELDVVDMSADGDCATSSIPPTGSDCYSAEIVEDLGGGISLTINQCLCIEQEGSDSSYSYQVDVVVVGASEVSLPSGELELCRDGGFFSQLLAVSVEDDTYYYNFDLAIPGEDNSSTLEVASAPNESAQAFICEDVAETEVVATTPSPTAPAVSFEDSNTETATATASTTGSTNGASSLLSRRSDGAAGVVWVMAMVLGSTWLSSFLSTAVYNLIW